MWNVKELFVLSDLHLTTERNYGLFQADRELADCLGWILKETEDSVIVLAGDSFDFLVPYTGNGDCSEKLNFECRTKQIIEQHAEVFQALTDLVQSGRHRLVIMGGDHDVELVFPGVQEAVERRLGVDFANPVIRWMVQGEGFNLRVGNAVTLIEHGNALSPWNRVNYASLQSAFSLASRNLLQLAGYERSLGGRLAMEVMSPLLDKHRWIDWLKPATDTTLPLLWHFGSISERDKISQLGDAYSSMREFAINRKLSNARTAELLYQGEREAETTLKDEIFEDWVRRAFRYVRLVQENDNKADNIREDPKLIEELPRISARDDFFDTDKPDELINSLEPIFKSGTDLVIHGHTHSAKACLLKFAQNNGLYLNTGTWGQLLQLPKSNQSEYDWRAFLDRLEKNVVSSRCRPTLARIKHSPQHDATVASLLEWKASGPTSLATYRFSQRQTSWQKEHRI